MKTNIFSRRNASFCSLIGILGILITSCGSYQNSSYYDTDGIYGNTENRNTEKVVQDNKTNHYKDYFNSMQDNQPTEIFTDVDSYSDYDTSYDTIQRTNSGYADWGNNYEKATINVYPNNWGLSLGFGYSYPYYGYGWGYSNYGWNYPYYGWGYSGYGWGYSGYGWNYPYYGYNNNSYSYNPSRRGSTSSNTVNGNRNYSQNQTSTNRESNYSVSRRNSTYSGTRTSPTFSRRNNNVQYQNNSSNNPTRSRANTSADRSQNESYSPSRSYNPSSNDNGRSSNSGDRTPSGGGRRGGR
jgi:hypothetical protein